MLTVAGLFGVAIEDSRHRQLFQDISIPILPGGVVLITGSSGAGKSTLLRALRQQLQNVLSLEEINAPADLSVVDSFTTDLDKTLAHLARAGLSEARLLLQSPATLSEGQLFRYRLAQFFAGTAQVLIVDEFAAILDRVTARGVACQLARFIKNSTKTAVLATTHEDLLEDLQPTTRIHVGLNGKVNILEFHGKQNHDGVCDTKCNPK